MTKEELEKENANLKALRKYELNVAKLEIEKLEQRNTELIALINAERERQEKCDDVHLRKIAELEKGNAELRNIAEFQQSSNKNRYFENKKLKDENTGLKEKLNIRSCQNCKHNNKSCPNDGSCVNYSKWERYINPELTKAKEIIKDYLTIIKGSHTTVCGVPEENRTIYVLKLNKEAEQFLKESN